MEDLSVKLFLIQDTEVENAIDIFDKSHILISPIKCYFCEEIFTLEKFAGFVPVKDKVAIFCANPICTFRAIFNQRLTNGNGEL